jgi:hypothetical protein
MREKYNIVGLHASETAGAKKYFDGKSNNEVLGKKDGHGFISVCNPLPYSCSLSFCDGGLWAVLMVGFDYLVLLWYLCSLSGKERS